MDDSKRSVDEEIRRAIERCADVAEHYGESGKIIARAIRKLETRDELWSQEKPE